MTEQEFHTLRDDKDHKDASMNFTITKLLYKYVYS